MTRRCSYCGSKTGVTPLQGMRSTQLSRALHSPLRAKFPPLCEAIKQGVAAMQRTKGR
jgi:hypothetical protein